MSTRNIVNIAVVNVMDEAALDFVTEDDFFVEDVGTFDATTETLLAGSDFLEFFDDNVDVDCEELITGADFSEFFDDDVEPATQSAIHSLVDQGTVVSHEI